MTATIKVTIELDPQEDAPPEAVAVQQMQNHLAALANMSVDELAAIYRLAVQKQIKKRARHRHGNAYVTWARGPNR